MNMNNKIYAILLIALLAGSTACKKAVEGYNDNPNNPEDADAITMLTSLEVANMVLQEGQLARHTGMWNGYFTGEQFQYQSIQQYLVKAQNFNDTWQTVYSSVIKNARLMRQKALAVNNLRLAGVAELIEANAAGTATALWGDIPFQQAANDKYPDPVFDPQQQVYDHIQSLLDSAIAGFSSGAYVNFSAQDVQFGGNMAQWIQTAYTLKARYYTETKQYDKALTAAENGISSPANNWLAPHSDLSKGTSNLWYQFLSKDRPGFMDADGAYAVQLLNPSDALYRGNAKTNEKARYKYLYKNTTDLNYGSNGYFYETVSYPMASYRENLLILAEADARVNGFMAGLDRLNTYRAWLNSGGYIGAAYLVAGDYQYDPYTAADFASGGIENPSATAIPDDRALLREIIQERYISFIGQIEGYNDSRRVYKETDIRVPVPANAGSSFPQRFLYPQDEVDLNSSTPSPIPDLFTPTPVNQ